MAEKILVKDLQKLDPGSELVYLFELEYVKGSFIYFHSGLDDDLSTIIKRYDTYMRNTKPVLDYYSKNSNFYELDGTLEIDEITAKIDDFINV